MWKCIKDLRTSRFNTRRKPETEFLATQPTNGARTSLGLTNNVSHSTYKFKGVNNFTSMFESRSTKTKLDKDYDFVLGDGAHAGETVYIKNWQDLDVFDISMMVENVMTRLHTLIDTCLIIQLKKKIHVLLMILWV